MSLNGPEEKIMRLVVNIRRTFRALLTAAREPEAQGALTLALSLIATVGYGDFAPKTALGKAFTIAYIFAGIGVFVAAVTAIAHAALHSEALPGSPDASSDKDVRR